MKLVNDKFRFKSGGVHEKHVVHSVVWQFIPDISGQPIRPLKMGPDKLSRNVSDKFTSIRCVITQKSAVLACRRVI